MQKLHRVIRTLLLVYVFVVTLTAGLFVAGLKFEHYRLLSVQTSSMVPTFRAGSLVVLRPVPADAIRAGDVVTFVNPVNAQTVSHRVLSIDRTNSELTTKGDNAPKADSPIRQSNVIGKVSVVLPYAGTVLDFVNKPLGLAIVLYLPAMAIVWNEIKVLSRHYGRGYYRLLTFRP